VLLCLVRVVVKFGRPNWHGGGRRRSKFRSRRARARARLNFSFLLILIPSNSSSISCINSFEELSVDIPFDEYFDDFDDFDDFDILLEDVL
jgi:hypothetical protein